LDKGWPGAVEEPLYLHKSREGKVTYNLAENHHYYSIVDQFGNAVAATTTANDSFGSNITAMVGFLK
jgi:gamma-glutamyltranspeptidase/glutathione hydrolase